jgi:hypothetical protein
MSMQFENVWNGKDLFFVYELVTELEHEIIIIGDDDRIHLN